MQIIDGQSVLVETCLGKVEAEVIRVYQHDSHTRVEVRFPDGLFRGGSSRTSYDVSVEAVFPNPVEFKKGDLVFGQGVNSGDRRYGLFLRMKGDNEAELEMADQGVAGIGTVINPRLACRKVDLVTSPSYIKE